MVKKIIITGWSLLSMAVFSITTHAELIEINRVTAKVNDRIVTWGEIERAMDRLNFTEEEKKKRASEFVGGKIDRLLSIYAFENKGMGIPESIIEQEYNKRLIKEFNGDRKLFRDVLRSNGQSQLEYRDELREDIIYSHMLSTRGETGVSWSLQEKSEVQLFASKPLLSKRAKFPSLSLLIYWNANRMATLENLEKLLFISSRLMM